MGNVLVFLTYLITTATGALLTVTLLGLIASAMFSDVMYFLVPLSALLVDRASTEKSNIVVIDKSEWDKNNNDSE